MWILIGLASLSAAGCGEAGDFGVSDMEAIDLPGDAAVRAVDRTLQQMELGEVAFNAPTRIEVGEVHEFHFALNPPRSAASLDELIPEEGDREFAEEVRFTDQMRAQLRGDGFEALPVTPEVQLVSGLEPTVWVWTVTALDPGTKTLRLTLDALVNIDGERVPRSIRTFNRSIEVAGTGPAGGVWAVVAGGVIGLLAFLYVGMAWRRRGATRAPVPSARPTARRSDGKQEQPHDVFISHSSKDGEVARTICEVVEDRGVSCWIAPRDITPGAAWDEAIMEALETARVMVLVLSGHSNLSSQVMKEVRNAVEAGITVVPFRIEDVELSKALRYHISAAHWLDAVAPPLNEHVHRLADSIADLVEAR